MIPTPPLPLAQSHFAQQGSNKWRTPVHIMERVFKVFGGPPDLDPASDAESNKTVQAKRYLGLDDVKPGKGVPGDWGAPIPNTIFINPPGGKFGNITLAKLLWHGARDCNMRFGSEVIWFAYNINQLQTLQLLPPSAFNKLTSTHICIPNKRLGCIDANTGLLQADPPSACAFIYLPSPLSDTGPTRFKLAFQDLGIILKQDY